MKKLLLFLVIACCCLAGFAHEFWLAPNKFFFFIREVAMIRFRVGENFTGQNWKGNRDKIQYLVHYTPADSIRDIASLVSASAGDSIRLRLSEEGTHMVVFNSTNSQLTLPADSFNAYLREEGLDAAIAYRKTHNEMDAAGREWYQRSVKTILQVGGKVTDACLKPTLLPLDIVPEENPYAIPAGTDRTKPIRLRFRVLFSGAPAANVLVRTWYRDAANRLQTDSSRTNKRGLVSVLRYPGPYMLSCVYMERMDAGHNADWQSYWASLTFEYSQFFPGKSGIYRKEP